MYRQTPEMPCWKILFCLSAGLWLSDCSPPSEPAVPEEPAQQTAPDSIRVDASALESGSLELAGASRISLPDTVQVTGRIGLNENRTVHIGSIVEGRITELLAMEGDSVRDGQVLAYLHSAAVHEARADYAQAVAEVQRCRAELEFAEAARDRAARLFELKAGSLVEKQRAIADYNGAEVALRRAEAEIGRIEENLRHMGVSSEGAAEEYLDKEVREAGTYEESELVPVIAPQRGTVLQRRVTPGTVVTPSDHLFLVSDLDSLWVHAEVPEKHLAALRKGQVVSVTVQAYGSEAFPARVYRIADEMNPETRTVHVICQMENPGRRLKSEMYANISFQTSEGRQALVIPFEAVQTIDSKEVVFVEQEDRTFKAREIRTGQRIDSLVEVVQGLSGRDRFVVRGSFLLKSELLKSQIEE